MRTHHVHASDQGIRRRGDPAKDRAREKMRGWRIPPPKEPTKTREELQRERENKVQRLLRQGLLRSDRLKEAMLKVAREDFLPRMYRDYAYREVPLPLPGK